MTSSDRPRRPDLDRDEPYRGFGSVFGTRPEDDGKGRSNAAFEDDIGRGVGVGYRLIEEYFRRGQQVAQSMWSQRPPSSAADFGMGAERMLEYTAQVMGLWFDMVKSAMPNSVPNGRPGAAPGGFEFATEAAVPEPDAAPRRHVESPTVSFHVASRLPVEVTVDLRADCQGKQLVALDLRTADGQAPRLRNVELSWIDGQRVRVSLQVPDGQCAGTYTGVIVDGATNLPLGTITATIHTG